MLLVNSIANAGTVIRIKKIEMSRIKQMKTVLLLEHEEKVFAKLTCDLCGAASNGDENWAKGDYDEANTVVQLQQRKSVSSILTAAI